jgi:hypothetical protein
MSECRSQPAECVSWSNAFGNNKENAIVPFYKRPTSGPRPQLIAENGASAHYWAKKTIRNGSIVTHQYSSASRNRLGQVVLMQTTDDRYISGKFTLVTQQQGCDTAPEPTDDEVTRLFGEEHAELLTDTH